MITDANNPEIQGILENHRKYEKRVRSTRGLPKFYSQSLTKTLRERLIESLTHTDEEQTSINEELALMRQVANVDVNNFALAQEAYELDKGNPESDGHSALLEKNVIIAGRVMHDSLAKVTRCAKTASDINKNAKETFTISDLHDIVGQLSRTLWEICGAEHLQIAELFEQRVEQDLTFIQAKTRVTPDMTVLSMDDTVPLYDGTE